MSRVYREPIAVQRRDDRQPAGFTWRERPYAVVAVLEYWLVNRDWWRESAPVPAQPELEFWRVEASPGPGRPAGVYELRCDIAADSWTLRKVAD